MEFTFNKNKPAAYPFLRIDRNLYKFIAQHNNEYKLDFKPVKVESSAIAYNHYDSFELDLTCRFDYTQVKDERVLPTCLQIIQDFLQKQVTAKAMLISQDELLSEDLFELKSQFTMTSLANLVKNEESRIYLIKDMTDKKSS